MRLLKTVAVVDVLEMMYEMQYHMSVVLKAAWLVKFVLFNDATGTH